MDYVRMTTPTALLLGYLPLKTGTLFSVKAFTASNRSSDIIRTRYPSFSAASPSCQLSTARMAWVTPIGPPSQMRLASCMLASRIFCRAAPSTFTSSGVISTTRLHRPRNIASIPFTLRPVRIKSLALLTPIRAGSLYVPPAPGMAASFTSGTPTTAVEAKTRNVVQRASSNPPPIAREETALMVGMGRFDRSVKVFRQLVM